MSVLVFMEVSGLLIGDTWWWEIPSTPPSSSRLIVWCLPRTRTMSSRWLSMRSWRWRHQGNWKVRLSTWPRENQFCEPFTQIYPYLQIWNPCQRNRKVLKLKKSHISTSTFDTAEKASQLCAHWVLLFLKVIVCNLQFL